MGFLYDEACLPKWGASAVYNAEIQVYGAITCNLFHGFGDTFWYKLIWIALKFGMGTGNRILESQTIRILGLANLNCWNHAT